jgi:hypothetical protein
MFDRHRLSGRNGLPHASTTTCTDGKCGPRGCADDVACGVAYRCELGTSQCFSTCASGADCQTGYDCVSNRCTVHMSAPAAECGGYRCEQGVQQRQRLRDGPHVRLHVAVRLQFEPLGLRRLRVRGQRRVPDDLPVVRGLRAGRVHGRALRRLGLQRPDLHGNPSSWTSASWAALGVGGSASCCPISSNRRCSRSRQSASARRAPAGLAPSDDVRAARGAPTSSIGTRRP